MSARRRRELETGSPDMRIPFNKNTIGAAEKAAVNAVLESRQLTMGERCRTFEQAFARCLGVEHAGQSSAK
jgi:dTDP-4-amino-4,6-dideoxygalactose transaminase